MSEFGIRSECSESRHLSLHCGLGHAADLDAIKNEPYRHFVELNHGKGSHELIHLALNLGPTVPHAVTHRSRATGNPVIEPIAFGLDRQ